MQVSKIAIRNVLVTGGAGYIGSPVVRKLLDKGYGVVAMDTLIYGDESIRDLYSRRQFKLINEDVRNIESVSRALRSVDAVVHLSALVGDPACALDESLSIEINLTATQIIAQAAQRHGIRHFIFASTCSVYGASDHLLDEDSPLNPVSVYARTKIESERVLSALDNGRFCPVILRFATVYGLSPRPRFDLVINLLAAQAVLEKTITIFGGAQWRPFIHVHDVAEAIIKCLEAPMGATSSRVFNVGSDAQNYQIAQISDLIKELIPGIEVILKGEDVDRRNYRVSFTKIREQLGFIPRRTVTEGILEIKHAIDEGRIHDYRDPRYSNYAWLSQHRNKVHLHAADTNPVHPVTLD